MSNYTLSAFNLYLSKRGIVLQAFIADRSAKVKWVNNPLITLCLWQSIVLPGPL